MLPACVEFSNCWRSFIQEALTGMAVWKMDAHPTFSGVTASLPICRGMSHTSKGEGLLRKEKILLSSQCSDENFAGFISELDNL